MEIKRKACTVYGVILLCGLVSPRFATAQDSKSVSAETRTLAAGQQTVQSAPNKTALPNCSDPPNREGWKERSKEQKSRFAALAANYQSWLNEDVLYLVTSEERCIFLHLAADQERDQFIDQFWRRRDPDPHSLENAFKQEHYRRIVWANEKYGAKIPGWKADRGRIYTCYGPPDEIESHPIDQASWKPLVGEPSDVKYSWEKWHYRYLADVGESVDIDFVEPLGSVDYEVRLTPEDEDRWAHNLARARQSGTGPGAGRQSVSYIGIEPSPVVKYKDLEAVVTARIIRDQVHFHQRIEYARATHASTVAKILVDISDDQLNPPTKEQNSASGYEILGRIAKPFGRIVFDFERSGEMDAKNVPGQRHSVREATAALEPGPYELAIVVKDIASGKVGVTHTTFEVPRFEELATGN